MAFLKFTILTLALSFIGTSFGSTECNFLVYDGQWLKIIYCKWLSPNSPPIPDLIERAKANVSGINQNFSAEVNTLSFHGTGYSMKTDWLRPFTNVERLEMDGTVGRIEIPLSIESGAFSPLTSLKQLIMATRYAPENLAQLLQPLRSRLEGLRLRGMNMTARLDAVQEFSALNWIMLDECNLSEFPTQAIRQSASSITSISINQSPIQSLRRQDFEPFVILEKLQLSYNEIESIESGAFDSLCKLKELDLRQNKLTSITEHMFKHNTELEFVDLNGNHIASIHPKAFKPLRKLRTLRLIDHQILNLTREFFKDNSQLTTLKLTPWD